MSGRKLQVDWKHTAEELYARYKNKPNTHIARRFQALALLRRGKPLQETAAIVSVSPRTVQKWLAWYRTDGVNALAHRRRGGNRKPVRPLLTPTQQAQLVHHATTQGFRTLREAVVWDSAGCHRARGVREVGVQLVYLPAYSPELNPVERVFCEVRRCVEGVLCEPIEAKMAAVDVALGGLCDGMVRLVGWDWIREALEGLSSD